MNTDDSGQIRGAEVGMGRLQPPQIFNRNGYLGRLQPPQEKVYKSRHFSDKTCFILDAWSASGLVLTIKIF